MKKEKIIFYIRNVLTYGFALFFIAAGAMKLLSLGDTAAEFQLVGLGTWFMYFVGVWELLAGVLVFCKKYRQLGLLLIVLASIGALIAQVFAIKEDWIHTVVMVVLSVWLLCPDLGKLKKLFG